MSSYRDSHMHKGEDYHSIFLDRPRVAMIWNLERGLLDSLVTRYFPIEPPRHLDFACGTGRILSHLSQRVSDSVGVDVSESMLAVARRNSPESEILRVDLTHEPALRGRKFDLITAFRFFPNAEPALRQSVIEALSPLLSERGIIVLNNHMSDDSLLRRLVRLKGGDPGHGMAMPEVNQLCVWGQLSEVERFGLGLLPVADQHVVAPRLMEGVERGLMGRPRLSRYYEDLVYVFRSL